MDNKGNFISRSLQVKLVLAVGLCLVFVSGLIIGYSAWVSYNDTVDNARQSAVKEAQFQMEQIKVRFNKAFDAARTMRDMIAAYKIKGQTAIPDRAYINDMLRTVLNQDSSFFGTYTLWEPDFDGKDADFANKPNYDSTGRLIPYWNRGGSNGEIRLDPIVGYDQPGLGDFYLIPRKTLKETIIDPFAYPVGDKNILMASLITPVVVDGKFYGITGVDMTLDTLQQMADSVDIYNKSGKVELISHTGIIAASSGQSQLIDKNLSDEMKDAKPYLDLIAAGKESVSVVGDNLVVYEPVLFGETDTPWSVRVSIPNSVIVAKANQDTLFMLILAVTLILLGLVGIWLLIKNIVIKDLKVMNRAMEFLGEGYIHYEKEISEKERMNIRGRHDEIGALARSLTKVRNYNTDVSVIASQIAEGNLAVKVTSRSGRDEIGPTLALMIDNLRSLIFQITENANNLNHASSQLASAADQAGQATNQIATTIQQVAQGITQQSEAVNKTASSAEQMERAIDGVARGAQEQSVAVIRASEITSQISSAIQQVTANAQTSAHGASQAAETAREGAKTIEETIKGMQSIRAKVGLSAEKVQEMGQRSDQIGAIVETIDDIASQTNLLALNAAIEAARAGEHGKGFSVVADEVRKLAERSSTATKEIGSLIKGIQKTVAEAVKAMTEGASEVENGVARAEQSGEALASILKAAELVSRQVEEIAGAAQKISASSSELVASMDTVSAVVEENTASTEQMAASSTEVAQAVESIASISEENSAAVEEVSASTEEMSAQVQEVTASAASMENMAQSLTGLIARFKLND